MTPNPDTPTPQKRETIHVCPDCGKIEQHLLGDPCHCRDHARSVDRIEVVPAPTPPEVEPVERVTLWREKDTDRWQGWPPYGPPAFTDKWESAEFVRLSPAPNESGERCGGTGKIRSFKGFGALCSGCPDCESGEKRVTECPTCGSDDFGRWQWRVWHSGETKSAAWSPYGPHCPDPFHQPASSDCEGDGEDETKWDLDTKLRMFDKGEEPGDERWTIWRRTCGELKGAWQIGTPPEVPPIPPYENEVVEVCPAYLLDALRRAYIDASSDLKRDT